MPNQELEITPSVTVHALLEAYPELEEVLIELAPPFKKLRNPFLRRSVAKIATLKHASSVGRVPLNELIGILRKSVGQSHSTESYDDQEYFTEKPEWFSSDKIMLTINEETTSNKNEMTLIPILRGAKNLKKGDILELVTSFLPAPGIDVMKSKGYLAWVKKENENMIKSYFLKTK